MKKLTAGIFATILGLTTVNAFAANQNGVASTQYVRGAMGSAVSTANAYTDTKVSGVNTALDGYMKVDAFNTFKTENTAAIESAASAAQTAATNAAASDATTKANTAEANAKAYTNTELAKKQNLLNGTNFKTSGDGNVISGFEVTDGVVTFSTASVATAEGLQELQGTVAGHTGTLTEQATAIGGLTTDLDTLQGNVTELQRGLGALETTVGDKENTLTGAKLDAVESGITAIKVQKYDAYEQSIAGAVSDASAAKADAAKAKLDAAAAVKDAGDALTEAGTASAAASEAKANAASAINTANSAASKAEQAETTAGDALTAANKATGDVATLTTTVNGNTAKIGEHATAISNLQTASATHATKAEVEAVDGKLANYVLVSSVVDEYVPAK